MGGVYLGRLWFAAAGVDCQTSAGGVGIDMQWQSLTLGLGDAHMADGSVDGAEGIDFAPAPAEVGAVVDHEWPGLVVVARGGGDDVADFVDSKAWIGLQNEGHDAGDDGARHGCAAHGGPDVVVGAYAERHHAGVGGGFVGPYAY